MTPFTISLFPTQPYDNIRVTGDIRAMLYHLR